jgi:DNA-directed RNA polymerase subunit RPC12/RpoP
MFYLIRWQLSTPILAVCLFLFHFGNVWNTVIANFLGGLIFFWVDKIIFRSHSPFSVWQLKENIVCSDCGKESRGYRLVLSKGYDKSGDKKPKFRCEECSLKKSEILKEKGIEI